MNFELTMLMSIHSPKDINIQKLTVCKSRHLNAKALKAATMYNGVKANSAINLPKISPETILESCLFGYSGIY